MLPEIAFRPITPEDQPFLFDLYASTRAEELAQVAWGPGEQQAFLRMQFNAQHTYYQQQFPKARFDIILVDGQSIGRLYLDERDDELRIIDIALLPAERGRGLGTRLLKEVLGKAGVAGKAVRIHVERFNPALRLYERLGFRQTGDNGVYLLMEWRAES